MFVWPHVNYLSALFVFLVFIVVVSPPHTHQLPVHNTLSRLALPPTTHPRSFSPGMLANYPTEFGKWKDFLLVSVVLLSIHYFLALADHPSGWLTAAGKGRPRDRNMYIDNEYCGTVWIRVFSNRQTEENENELEGEGLEDFLLSIRFMLVGSFERLHPPDPTFFFFIFCRPLFIVLHPPLSSPFIHRALRYIIVALIVLVRLSLCCPSLSGSVGANASPSLFISLFRPFLTPPLFFHAFRLRMSKGS